MPKSVDVTFIRVFLNENAHPDTLLKRLHDWGHVRGVTVFRGVAGFGTTSRVEDNGVRTDSASLVVELFEFPAKAAEIIDYLSTFVEPGHIVYWPARLVVGDD